MMWEDEASRRNLPKVTSLFFATVDSYLLLQHVVEYKIRTLSEL